MTVKSFIQIILSIIIAQSAGIIGSLFTVSSRSSWYLELIKPALNPPDWVFGPVWTTLYILMGIAAFLIWKNNWKNKETKIALGIYCVQLVLNATWSIVFFGNQNTGGALIIILALWLAILATIIAFHKISKPAAYLLIPYILWVSFATYLNYSIWTLN